MTSRTGPMDLFPSQLGQPWDSVVSYEHEKTYEYVMMFKACVNGMIS